jgi:ankyrin repeat protein
MVADFRLQGPALPPLRRTKSVPDFKTATSNGQDVLRRRDTLPSRLQPLPYNRAESTKSHGLLRPSATQSAAQLESFAQLLLKRAGLPYTPSKGDSEVNLNCEVELSDELPDAEGATNVTCRHFVAAFVEKQGKKRGLVDHFSTSDGIRSVFSGSLAQANKAFYDTLRSAPQHARHLVDEAQFGAYVGAIVQALIAGGDTDSVNAINAILVASDHTMALQVQRKQKHGEIYFTAKVFDPNNTGNYRRMNVKDLTPEALARLQFNDFLIDPTAAVDLAVADEPLSMSAICVDTRLNLQLPQMHFSASAQVDELPTKSELYTVLSSGMIEGLAAITARVSNLVIPMPEQVLVELLSASNETGMCGLHWAVMNGHVDAVKAFGNTMSALGLSSEAKAAIISNETIEVGLTPLYIAIRREANDMVNALKVIIEELALPHDARFQILAAKDNNGMPALIAALSENKFEAARAATAMFTELDIDPQDVLDLLDPYRPDIGLLSDAARHELEQLVQAQKQRLDEETTDATD